MDNLDQTKRELMDEVKGKLIEELNLEEITPEDIDNEAPLFGDEGLGTLTPLTHSKSSRFWNANTV